MKTSNVLKRNGCGLHVGAIFWPIDHSPNTYTFICVNFGINGMEAHIRLGELMLLKLIS